MNPSDWINRSLYPFESRFLFLESGRMHFVDEGSGGPIVMVHGNPTWSFVYRELIKGLSPPFRCIAMDHIGFGLSDKPEGWSYRPADHAGNLEKLIETLGLKKITLVVQDWGGPIGLSYAVRHPDNVRSIVILNTWMWPVSGVLHYELFSRLMGGAPGRFLIRRFNFFVTVLMRQMFHGKMPKEVYRHYVMPLNHPKDRKGCRVFPKEILGSGQWLAGLWSRREVLRTKPALILWGMRDIAFRKQELNRWTRFLPHARVERFEKTGHFVQDEKGEDICPIIDAFLRNRHSSGYRFQPG